MRSNDKISGMFWREGDTQLREWSLSISSTSALSTTMQVGDLSQFLSVPGVVEQLVQILPKGSLQVLISQHAPAPPEQSGSIGDVATQRLWELLDDVSTAGDQFKPSTLEEFQAYYRHINEVVDKRFQVMKVGRGERLIATEQPSQQQPLAIRVHCPECHKLHVDEGIWSTKPHDTHSCQNCGLTWKPARVPTVGVQFLPGYKNDE